MGLMTRLADWLWPEERSRSSRDPYLAEYFGLVESGTGQLVTAERAAGLAVAHACIQVIAESLASVPLAVYRRTEGGGLERDQAHPLYAVLHDQANRAQTAFEAREMMVASVVMTGNGYARIIRDPAGRVAELLPLLPGHVQVSRLTNGRLIYQVTLPAGRTERLLQDEVLHLKYRTRDGIRGLSPISIAAETFGLGLAQQEAQGAMLKNGARMGGVVTHPGKLSEPARNNLSTSFKDAFAGVARAGKTLILEEGMKYETITMTARDAEFLESRRLTNEDVCRIFRVPPPSVGILDKATYSNITEQSRALVVHCLRPWAVRIEQAMGTALLSAEDRLTHVIEHNLEGLARGDLKTRYEAFRIGREWGWLNANEIRAMENMPAIEGGETYLTPMNATTRPAADPGIGAA